MNTSCLDKNSKKSIKHHKKINSDTELLSNHFLKLNSNQNQKYIKLFKKEMCSNQNFQIKKSSQPLDIQIISPNSEITAISNAQSLFKKPTKSQIKKTKELFNLFLKEKQEKNNIKLNLDEDNQKEKKEEQETEGSGDITTIMENLNDEINKKLEILLKVNKEIKGNKSKKIKMKKRTHNVNNNSNINAKGIERSNSCMEIKSDYSKLLNNKKKKNKRKEVLDYNKKLILKNINPGTKGQTNVHLLLNEYDTNDGCSITLMDSINKKKPSIPIIYNQKNELSSTNIKKHRKSQSEIKQLKDNEIFYKQDGSNIFNDYYYSGVTKELSKNYLKNSLPRSNSGYISLEQLIQSSPKQTTNNMNINLCKTNPINITNRGLNKSNKYHKFYKSKQNETFLIKRKFENFTNEKVLPKLSTGNFSYSKIREADNQLGKLDKDKNKEINDNILVEGSLLTYKQNLEPSKVSLFNYNDKKFYKKNLNCTINKGILGKIINEQKKDYKLYTENEKKSYYDFVEYMKIKELNDSNFSNLKSEQTKIMKDNYVNTRNQYMEIRRNLSQIMEITKNSYMNVINEFNNKAKFNVCK